MSNCIRMALAFNNIKVDGKKKDKYLIWTKWPENNLPPPKLFYVDQVCINDVFAINDGSI